MVTGLSAEEGLGSSVRREHHDVRGQREELTTGHGLPEQGFICVAIVSSPGTARDCQGSLVTEFQSSLFLVLESWAERLEAVPTSRGCQQL